jgi:hypothetical protein
MKTGRQSGQLFRKRLDRPVFMRFAGWCAFAWCWPGSGWHRRRFPAEDTAGQMNRFWYSMAGDLGVTRMRARRSAGAAQTPRHFDVRIHSIKIRYQTAKS